MEADKPWERTLAELLIGLRQRGLAIGPDDSKRIALVFQHSQTWSRQRRVRVLQCLLATNEQDALLIQQLAPLLFIHADRQHQEPEPTQTVFSPKSAMAWIPPDHDLPPVLPSSLDPPPPPTGIPWRRGLVFLPWLIIVMLVAVLSLVRETLPPIHLPDAWPSVPTDILARMVAPLHTLLDLVRAASHALSRDFFLLLFFCMATIVGMGGWYYGSRWLGLLTTMIKQWRNLEALARSSGPRRYLPCWADRSAWTPLPAEALREAAFHLCAPTLPAAADWVNPVPTVMATVKRCGMLTLVYGTSLTQRPLLLIEDRGISMAKWPGMGKQIADSLMRQGTEIAHWYMLEQPTTLYRTHHLGDGVPFDQALGGYADPLVIVLSDAAILDRPENRMVTFPWLGELSHAIWLHPASPEFWGPGTRLLAERVTVLPLTGSSLGRLGSLQKKVAGDLPPMWKPPVAMGTCIENQVALVRDLAGEAGLRWLAAGAILDHVGVLTPWNWWALHLDGTTPVKEQQRERIHAMVEMTWLSDGTMRLPKDLRQALIAWYKEDSAFLPHIATWAIRHIEKDLQPLKRPSLAWVQAETARIFLQDMVPSRREEARRRLKEMAKQGYGGWAEAMASEQERQAWHDIQLVWPSLHQILGQWNTVFQKTRRTWQLWLDDAARRYRTIHQMIKTGPWETLLTKPMPPSAIPVTPDPVEVVPRPVVQPPPAELEPFHRFLGKFGNRYVPRLLLGEGGFGATYLVQDTERNKDVVIKTAFFIESSLRHIHSTRALQTTTQIGPWQLDIVGTSILSQEEAQILATFVGKRNPHIVELINYFEVNDLPCLVLEYIDGVTLDKLLRRGIRFSEEDLLVITHAMLAALNVIHRQNMVHADIKPSNIMFRLDGTPVLIDFGACVLPSASNRRSPMFTPRYSSPERDTLTQMGPWSDYYSLGAVLFHCVYGHPPLDVAERLSSNPAMALAVDVTKVTCTPAFRKAIDQALQLSPERRPRTATEFLEGILEKEKIGKSTNLAVSSTLQATLSDFKGHDARENVDDSPTVIPDRTEIGEYKSTITNVRPFNEKHIKLIKDNIPPCVLINLASGYIKAAHFLDTYAFEDIKFLLTKREDYNYYISEPITDRQSNYFRGEKDEIDAPITNITWKEIEIFIERCSRIAKVRLPTISELFDNIKFILTEEDYIPEIERYFYKHQTTGNIWEWCEDAHELPGHRYIVGGSAMNPANLENHGISFLPEHERRADVGFRLVYVPESPTTKKA